MPARLQHLRRYATATAVRTPNANLGGKFKRVTKGKEDEDDENKKRGSRKSRSGIPTGSFTPLPASTLEKVAILNQRLPPVEYPTLTPKLLSSPDAGVEGTIATFRTQNQKGSSDIFSAYGVPKNVLVDFRFFPHPVSVVTSSTSRLVKRLKKAEKTQSRDNRIVIHGEAGCGKSYTLLQGVNWAHQQGWITIYIPRANNLVDSRTEYIYDPRTRTYLQNTAARELLTRLLKLERAKLAAIQVGNDVVDQWEGVGKLLQTGAQEKTWNLAEIIEASLVERAPTMEFLQVVFAALAQQETYPILLAIDSFQALFHRSLYRTPGYDRILSYHLSVPRLLLQFCSSPSPPSPTDSTVTDTPLITTPSLSFKRGAILAAISASDTTFPPPLELTSAFTQESLGAWTKLRRDYLAYAEGLEPFSMPRGMTVREAGGLFELWKGIGLGGLASPANDQLFLSKFTESGGNPRDFVWKGLLATLQC